MKPETRLKWEIANLIGKALSSIAEIILIGVLIYVLSTNKLQITIQF